MNDFSSEAQERWAQSPDSSKQKILATVWCAQCRMSVSIVNLTGSVEGDSLVLRGNCGYCGHTVARVLEGQ
jgi:hypothetical protein